MGGIAGGLASAGATVAAGAFVVPDATIITSVAATLVGPGGRCWSNGLESPRGRYLQTQIDYQGCYYGREPETPRRKGVH
jgi:hypothetical protein